MNRSVKVGFIISFLLHLSVFCLVGFDHNPPPTKKIEISLVMDQTKQETPIAKKDPAKKKRVIKKKKRVIKKKKRTPMEKRKVLKDMPEPIIDPRPDYCLRDDFSLCKRKCVALNNPELRLPQFQKEELPQGEVASGKSSLIQWYLGLIWQKIEEAKVYPETARRNNQEGMVKVQFLILKNGKVKEVAIIKSSGRDPLDQATLETIEKATPFPPIPPLLELEEINVKIPIVFELERRF